jgi:hypothetical protein
MRHFKQGTGKTWARPNNRLQPTPYSLRCATASGRG